MECRGCSQRHSHSHCLPMCSLHNKSLDIYCEKDRKLLCSECIIHQHQHHKLCTAAQKAEKERKNLGEHGRKVGSQLDEYKQEDLLAEKGEVQIQHAFMDCQVEANLFFQTIVQEVQRLKQKQKVRLVMRKEQSLKRFATHRQQLQEQITFLSEVHELCQQLMELGDAQFLMQEDKHNFIIDSTRNKKDKYTPPTLIFRKSTCLQEVSKSIQEMMSVENGRVITPTTPSPSLKKHKQPAILQVNLKQQYHRRKGITQPPNKSKPSKKTISIVPQHDKNQSILSLRKASYSMKQQKVQMQMRDSSAKRSDKYRQMNDSILSVGDLSNSFTPMSSIHSFMRSSRQNSEADSLLNDSTLRQTFNQFSALGSDDCIYHLGGLNDCYSEKYHPETTLSESLQSQHSQLKGRNFCSVRIKTTKGQLCLLVGPASSNANKTSNTEIYQFSFKEERISKSSIKITQPNTSFGCVGHQGSLFLIGGKIHQKALNSFQCYRYQNNEFLLSKMPNMHQPRFDLGCCLGFDGRLYALGGITPSNDSTTTGQRFDLRNPAWTSIAPMKYPRTNFVAVSTPRGIFVIGGHTTKRFLKEVQFFDYEDGRWIEKASMLHPRCYQTALLSKDYQTITIFGGFSQGNTVLDSIEVYDIDRNEWRSGGKMRQKRCLHVSIHK